MNKTLAEEIEMELPIMQKDKPNIGRTTIVKRIMDQLPEDYQEAVKILAIARENLDSKWKEKEEVK